MRSHVEFLLKMIRSHMKVLTENLESIACFSKSLGLLASSSNMEEEMDLALPKRRRASSASVGWLACLLKAALGTLDLH